MARRCGCDDSVRRASDRPVEPMQPDCSKHNDGERGASACRSEPCMSPRPNRRTLLLRSNHLADIRGKLRRRLGCHACSDAVIDCLQQHSHPLKFFAAGRASAYVRVELVAPPLRKRSGCRVNNPIANTHAISRLWHFRRAIRPLLRPSAQFLRELFPRQSEPRFHGSLG
jgi:hypothetical protein